ncbi:MAG: glycosyltransferase family 39 protein, partial [Prolixibacteraceae bacterium]|nr:glycosyltransferase family 39 protein [Prolixibacteraceae bacterium]
MSRLLKQQIFWIGVFVFFAINILQAAYLELHFDEAYYWLYSRNLSWGYFDHPPMVAALIFAGTKLFGGFLGVRFFFVVLSTVSFILLWDLVKPYYKLPLIFWLMAFSISLWIPYSFYAVPDVPLFFFTVLFLWLYQKYLREKTWGIVFALVFATAGLIYSKYHGFLLLFFVFLSNWKLIKERKAWVFVFLTLILLIPHFLWQYENHFPTFRYHLVDSHQSTYKIDVTLNYLLGMVLLTGPFLGWLFLYSAFKYRPSGDWEKALKFVFAGVFLFFFIVTFGGDIELHWPLIAYIPMFILAYIFIGQNERWQRLVKKVGIIGFFIFLSLRVYLVLGASTCPVDAIRKMVGWRDEMAILQNEAKGRPVVFQESYQKASFYAFYTKSPYTTYALLSGFYKYSQFDLYPTEDNIQGKDVLFVSMDSTLMGDNARHIKGNIKNWYLRDISDFNSFQMLEISADTSVFLLKDKVLKIP